MNSKNKLLLTPVLLLVIVMIISQLGSPKYSKVTEELFWLEKVYSDNKNAIVIGGDSRVSRGVSPECLIEGLQNKDSLTCQNFGFHSAGYSQEYLDFLFSKLDFSKNDPPVLLLGITPNSLTENARRNTQLKQYQTFDNLEKDKLQTFDFLYSLISPFRTKEVLRSIFNIDAPEEVTITYHQDGWEEVYFTKIDSNIAFESYNEIFTDNEVINNSVMEFIINLKEIKKKNVKIVLFKPPTSFSIDFIEDQKSKFDELLFIDELSKIDVHYYEFDKKNFTCSDGSHLQPKSAKEFSNQLSKILKKEMSRP